jgi:hypothetical protein
MVAYRSFLFFSFIFLVEEWSSSDVLNWCKVTVKLENEIANILYNQNINGKSLLKLTEVELRLPPFNFSEASSVNLALEIQKLSKGAFV